MFAILLHLQVCNGDTTETSADEFEDEKSCKASEVSNYPSQEESTASEPDTCAEEGGCTDGEDPNWNFEEEFIEDPDDDDEDNEDPIVESKNTVMYVCGNVIGIV